MAQTPSLDGLAAIVASAKKEIAEAARKTLSTLAVTAANGVRMLNIAPDAANSNRPQVTIRDSNGNALIQNDTAAGWGFSRPIFNYPMYPFSGLTPYQTTSTSYKGVLFSGINTLSKQVDYGFYVEWNGTVSSVNVKLTYQPSGGTETTIEELTITGTSGQNWQNRFQLPVDVYLRSTNFTAYARVNTGAGTVSVVPDYFQTRGQNV